MSGDERGMSPALELTVLLPALVMLIMLVVGASRIWWAQWSVRAAADSAARQASISRTAGEAVTSAEALVRGDAASSGLRCSDGLTVTVDAAGIALKSGNAALLRGSASAHESNKVLVAILSAAAAAAGANAHRRSPSSSPLRALLAPTRVRCATWATRS